MSATMSTDAKAVFLEKVATDPTIDHLDEVATEHGMFLEEAKELVQRHGWPRADSLRHAADVLRRGGSPGNGLSAVPTRPALTVPPPSRPNLVESLEQLLEVARGHDVKRIVSLAGRIDDQVDSLRDLIDADRHNAKARADVARLKKELAAAQAKLTPGKAKAPTTVPTGMDSKTIRAWAAEQHIECASTGRVPAGVVAAYREAHG